MDIKKVTAAIEADAGETIEGLHESLAEMQADNIARRYSPEQLLLQAARKALNLSQTGFADLIKTPVATLRDWEQGRSKPVGSAVVVCEIAIKTPAALLAVS